jgi:hypothetical protein
LRDADIDLQLLGFNDEELSVLLADADRGDGEADVEEEIPAPPVQPVTRAGDIWCVGRHRLICGDCRDPEVVARLFDGAHASMVFTSPPYATQREYDPSSGFQPVRPDEYAEWFRPVAANIASVLAPDGSYFLNIKEHAEDGERCLYVKDQRRDAGAVLECVEAGPAQLVERDYLAVNHGLVGHCGESLDYRRVLSVEILIVAGPKMDSAPALDRLGAEAVQLQLVQPHPALGKFLGGLQEHRFDKAGFGLRIGHQELVCPNRGLLWSQLVV